MEVYDLVSRLTHGPRRAPRIKRAFGIRCSSDGGRTFEWAYPVDISTGGIGFITRKAPRDRELLLALTLDRKRIRALASPITTTKGKLNGDLAWRTGAQFDLLHPEEMVMVDRFVRRLPLEAPSSPQAALRALRMWPESADRVLPVAMLDKIVNELAELHRLAPQRPNLRPLVRFRYTGPILRDGRWLHGLKIESRIVDATQNTIYTTQAYIDENLSQVDLIPLDDGRPGTLLEAIPQPQPDTGLWKRFVKGSQTWKKHVTESIAATRNHRHQTIP